MKVLSLVRYAAGIVGGVSLLAGCSNNGTTPSFGGSAATQSVGGYHHSIQQLNRQIAMTNPQHTGVPAVRHPLTHSWFKKAPKGTTGTIWATDSEYGSVDMIAYPSGTLLGQVSGFEYPYGNCSDKSGNVYVADFDLEELVELNHSGSVVNSYPTGGEAFGCSVAPNGDVAVTNFDPGDVVIVAGPDAGANWGGEALDWPGGFDRSGNFYMECADESPCSSPSLYEWPKGGSSWKHLNLDKAIGFPGGIQNMGKYLGLADQQASGDAAGIDLVTVSGSDVTVQKTIILHGGSCGNYLDFPSSWGSINKRPDGVITQKVKDIAVGNVDCFPSPISIYKAKNGDFIKSIGPVTPYQYDHGVTFTKP